MILFGWSLEIMITPRVPLFVVFETNHELRSHCLHWFWSFNVYWSKIFVVFIYLNHMLLSIAQDVGIGLVVRSTKEWDKEEIRRLLVHLKHFDSFFFIFRILSLTNLNLELLLSNTLTPFFLDQWNIGSMFYLEWNVRRDQFTLTHFSVAS